jgi:hypothetical protein
MKFVIRTAFFILVVAAAAVGNSQIKTSTVAAAHASNVPGGGPIPMCNPFTENCPNIR